MIVTSLDSISKNRVKVYIDYEFKFALYTKELVKYNIELNQDISLEQISQIEATILIRAKRKALNLLKVMDRTELQLINKLRQSNFNNDIIALTLDYVKSYNYIDDDRYVNQYAQYKTNGKSKTKIISDLYSKGIDRNSIDEILENNNYNEYAELDKLVKKKLHSGYKNTQEEYKKIYSYLQRQGFRGSDISSVLKEYFNNREENFF